jgi:hypothetical protein
LKIVSRRDDVLSSAVQYSFKDALDVMQTNSAWVLHEEIIQLAPHEQWRAEPRDIDQQQLEEKAKSSVFCDHPFFP